jgi:hypothetical protein
VSMQQNTYFIIYDENSFGVKLWEGLYSSEEYETGKDRNLMKCSVRAQHKIQICASAHVVLKVRTLWLEDHWASQICLSTMSPFARVYTRTCYSEEWRLLGCYAVWLL